MDPIRFYFDFASPYAYFSLDQVERIAAEHGRGVEWRPVLVWAILKAHGIAPPLDTPVKRAYFTTDMVRSAAFHGVPYNHPDLPISAHRAGRLYYATAERDPASARALGRDIFRAFFVDGEDITDEAALARIAARHGIEAETAQADMNGETGRALLASAVETAIAEGVCGSPHFIVDGEGFFGSDRLPQIAWRLSGGRSRAVR